jgi:hypothetical protein
LSQKVYIFDKRFFAATESVAGAASKGEFWETRIPICRSPEFVGWEEFI